jgi:hypothetical protein
MAVLGLAVAVVVLLGGVRTASADPVNAKKAEILEVTCTGGVTGTFDVVSNGNSIWTPGHVIGSNQVLVPYAFEFTFTFTPSDGGDPIVETESFAKKGPRNGRLAECTFSETETSPEGTAELIGVVSVSYTPAD